MDKTSSLSQTSQVRVLSLIILFLGLFFLTGAKDASAISTKTLIHQATEKNSKNAQYKLGYRYEKGRHVKRSYTKAIKWYLKAAKNNHKNAQYRLGILYYKKKQYSKARPWLKKRAKRGLADAQYHLGNLYRYGYGIKRNSREALKWYKKAAKQRHKQAQYELGLMYKKGAGTKKNKALAYKWLKAAARKGHKQAKKVIAKMPKPASAKKVIAKKSSTSAPNKRKDTKKSKKAANIQKKKPLLETASLNDPESQYELGMRYLLGFQTSPDSQQAIHWLKQAAAQNHAFANYHVGSQYLQGSILPQNTKLAIQHFTIAAEQDVPPAKTALTNLALGGFENLINTYTNDANVQFKLAQEYLLSTDPVILKNGLIWLNKAAEGNHPEAHYLLGQFYEQGNQVKKDLKIAFSHYKVAAEQNHLYAQFKLSEMYRSGAGTRQDFILAADWLGKAAGQSFNKSDNSLQFSEL